ncbi:MAG: hypothetical protein QG567_271 [Campylobacterota bacterium]|nr:hypothetical protein [Campylobacterota bacterium]
MKKGSTMKAEELDKIFDDGIDISEYLDMSTIKKANMQTKKVNVDFPEWIINSLDQEAKKIGVTRQSIIKMWIAQRLKAEKSGQFAS